MMKMKRLISTIVAISFVLSMGTTAVFASQKNKDGRWLPPGIAKKVFSDIEKFPWAEQAIEKMRLKGLIKGKEEDKFAPENAVTKLETIIMALRIMGWESETANLNELPKKYKGKEINEWAKGYVAVAFDKGILDDVDMMYFNPEEPAKRHEVAKYVIRAIGFEDEAISHMEDSLTFKDASAIPMGSIGYVYMVNKMDLMVGSNDKFNPMGTLTRAEMAVLFQRLDDKVDNDIDDDEYQGQIQSISESKIILNINGELKTFDVNSDVKVYDNNKRISYSNLSKDNFVLVQLDDNEVTYIEVIDKDYEEDRIISKYKGTVTDISNSNPNKITLQIDKMQIIFEATTTVEVYFKNEEGSFDDIIDGDSVSIIVDSRNRAREIEVDRELNEQDSKEIEGTIKNIDLTGTYHLTIDNTRYVLSKNADVTIENETNSEIDDLEINQEGSFIIENNEIVKVVIEKQDSKEIEGTIKNIDLTGTYHLTIDNTRYVLSKNADVTIENETNSEIDDLEINQEGSFTIENNEIVKIVIED